MTLNDLHKYLTDQNEKLVEMVNRNTGLPGDIQEKLKDAASRIAFAADNLICDPGISFAAAEKARLEILKICRFDFTYVQRNQILEVFYNLKDSIFEESMIDNALSKRGALRGQ